MEIKYQDIISLNDKNKYVVASLITYKNKKYSYLVDINNVTNFKFIEIQNDNTLLELDANKDNELIKTLISLFYDFSKKDIKINND